MHRHSQLALGYIWALAWGVRAAVACQGIAAPELGDDGGEASVDVILAQAPLFSSDKSIGKKLGLLDLFHSAIVFRQGGANSSSRYWTLEFDAIGNVVSAECPAIAGSTLTWNNDARYCLTEGVYWGEKHWSKTYEVVMRITSAQARSLFKDFVQPLNGTSSRGIPFYQLWHVVQGGSLESVVQDISCGDGAMWVLNYIVNTLGVPARDGFVYRYTRIFVRADNVTLVNSSDPAEWKQVVAYYQWVASLGSRANSIGQKFVALLHAVPIRYVFDRNAGVYYRLLRHRYPFLQPRFDAAPLAGPPWQRVRSGSGAVGPATMIV